jgi:hypothetical protein
MKSEQQLQQLPYEPPTIEDVPLHPDEQVVAGCKTSHGPAPGVGGGTGFGCGPCRTPNPS